MNQNLRINGERLLSRLAEMAQIGVTEKGGVCRVALSDEDKVGRDLFIEWCQAANCNIAVDQIGNIFARRNGSNEDFPMILTGSHLDSQPTGGKFDGVYGVLAALEVLETLNDHDITTTHPVDIVSWTNEEGARFAPGLTGSGVYTGVFDLEEAYACVDKDGFTLGEELQRIGYAGKATPGSRSIKAALEIHIEQGPILEEEGIPIGVVRGVQGMYWYDLVFEGQEAHAGTTPMERRKDPVAAAVSVIEKIYQLNENYAPEGRATFGDFIIEPGSRNTVPGKLTVTLDYRHPEEAVLRTVDRNIRSIVNAESETRRIKGWVDEIWYMPPVIFSPECIAAVQHAADHLGYLSREMVSGAGHDAMYLAQVAPTGMIFIPCDNGLSHNELENAQPEDLIAGGNVLLHAILELANPQVN
jgi:N-carbamoyl-L-amino-acid hydrolase